MRSCRQKLSQGLPAALMRLLSETSLFEIAPIVAVESILSFSDKPSGHAFIAIAAAANSGMKLLPSERITRPPDHKGLFSVCYRYCSLSSEVSSAQLSNRLYRQ